MRPGRKHIPNGDDGLEGAADAVEAPLLFPGCAITTRVGSALAELEVANRVDLRRTMPVVHDLARLRHVPIALGVVCIGVAAVAGTVLLVPTARTDG